MRKLALHAYCIFLKWGHSPGNGAPSWKAAERGPFDLAMCRRVRAGKGQAEDSTICRVLQYSSRWLIPVMPIDQGLMDNLMTSGRVCVQVVMAMFSYLYYNSYVAREIGVTVGSVLTTAMQVCASCLSVSCLYRLKICIPRSSPQTSVLLDGDADVSTVAQGNRTPAQSSVGPYSHGQKHGTSVHVGPRGLCAKLCRRQWNRAGFCSAECMIGHTAQAMVHSQHGACA